MTKSTNSRQSVGSKDYMLALDIIAANTMCTRKAVGVAAKIGKTLIVSTVAITISTIVLLVNHDAPSWLTFVCWIVIATFGLFTILYSLSLLGELDRTTELVSEGEAKMLGGEDVESDQDDRDDGEE